jgi:hypothetical protein
MQTLNWIRIALCGFVAGVTWHLLSILILFVFAPDLTTSLQRLAPYQRQGGVFFFAIDVFMGIWAVWLYSAIAPQHRARFTAVAVTGFAWWTLKTLQSAKWAGLGLMTLGPNLLPVGVASLGATLFASVLGGWLYGTTSRLRQQPDPIRR